MKLYICLKDNYASFLLGKLKGLTRVMFPTKAAVQRLDQSWPTCMDSERHFFAKSHYKTACDGIVSTKCQQKRKAYKILVAGR
jgi:hypothetical protein